LIGLGPRFAAAGGLGFTRGFGLAASMTGVSDAAGVKPVGATSGAAVVGAALSSVSEKAGRGAAAAAIKTNASAVVGTMRRSIPKFLEEKRLRVLVRS
jgi:hypothetical protein